MLDPTSYTELGDRFLAAVPLDKPAAPEMLAWNTTLAETLGLVGNESETEQLALLFPSGTPAGGGYALAYAGHQFGQFVPSLGDGRALIVGELRDRHGERYDLQLKGSGRTPFSRGGDGLAALGPVVREYVLCEAMYALGIPTTRALAALRTGAKVLRERRLPGAMLARVAASHLRIGSFEYFAARGDKAALTDLLDFALKRHYPDGAAAASPALALLDGVANRQAELVARWQSVGFIHGVMNTDNVALSGETIDYGPCAFMDEYRHDKVFSSIDRFGRYAYANQPAIAQWNLARLADCLLVIADEREQMETIVADFARRFDKRYLARMRAKLGLTQEQPGDAELVADILAALEAGEHDFTLGFRTLAERVDDTGDALLGEAELRWRERLTSEPGDAAERMNAVNPLYIPRNHRVEEAIGLAEENDLSMFHAMLDVLSSPFTQQDGAAWLARPPSPAQRVTQTFCGT